MTEAGNPHSTRNSDSSRYPNRVWTHIEGTAYSFFTTENARLAKELIPLIQEAGSEVGVKDEGQKGRRVRGWGYSQLLGSGPRGARCQGQGLGL